jgi:hypothetical protein
LIDPANFRAFMLISKAAELRFVADASVWRYAEVTMVGDSLGVLRENCLHSV